jgi:putative ABC transport system substrate-binding protein
MDRRAFLGTLAGGLLAAPLAADAQQAGKVYSLGHIVPRNFDQPDRSEQRAWPAFVDGLRSLGWVEGKNITFVRHPISGWTDLLKAAEEFVRINVDIILCLGGHRAQRIQEVTTKIPIVTLNSGELVSSGIVASLARAGGNITGMQGYTPELMRKNVQILKELVPRLTRIAVLRRGPWHPGILAAYKQGTDEAAQALGIRARYGYFQNLDELPALFSEIARERETAVIIWDDPGMALVASEVLTLTGQHRLATMGEDAGWTRLGALVSYGAKLNDIYRQAATYVDKILKGAKAADLPIGQPSTFDLIINLKTAKALGLTIPPSLLQRADQVIE